jgi:mono/diheme cytochrome c family protein
VVLTAGGCRQDMHDQPTYSALEASTFFEDGRASRGPVEGTVPRGHLNEDEAFYAGMVGFEPVMEVPVPVDEALVGRGRDVFQAFCSPCHGPDGTGNGPVVQRGFTPPPDLTDLRIQEGPAGLTFMAITNGFGAMPDYRVQITPADRWRIAAYIRALQLSHSATERDVPAAELSRLKSGAPAPTPAAGHGREK